MSKLVTQYWICVELSFPSLSQLTVLTLTILLQKLNTDKEHSSPQDWNQRRYFDKWHLYPYIKLHETLAAQNPPFEPVEEYTCKICGRTFSTTQSLAAHIDLEHPEAEQPEIF